ncbi:hypothetical protein HPB47_014008 [Ixodes persulcatus]|uniref:Uncharacterized protein n=1 Tax=Ixodes persulcatus TaxID=34615 RepID=A0AC60QYY2_IXOPE|nr:hypothetical protein HPB47_014008 [Ixodes persulcatus]
MVPHSPSLPNIAAKASPQETEAVDDGTEVSIHASDQDPCDQQDPEKVPPHKERKFIVFEGRLFERFRVCRKCFGPCHNTTVVSGTLLMITSTCTNEHKETWRSQPKVYERRNTELLERLRGKAIDLAGDGRCDSPGFSAKYCTYTFHEATTKKIIHMEQVQVGEAIWRTTGFKMAPKKSVCLVMHLAPALAAISSTSMQQRHSRELAITWHWPQLHLQ